MKTVFLKYLLIIVFSLSGISYANDGSKEDKLNELVDVMDMQATLDVFFQQMEMVRERLRSDMGISAEEQDIYSRYDQQITDLILSSMSWEIMKTPTIAVYNKHFSEAEIDGLLEFYKSPAGQAYLDRMPAVTSETANLTQLIMQDLMPKIQKIAYDLSKELERSREGQK